MATTDIFMPALSSTMTEGKIVEWLKQPGDTGCGEAGDNRPAQRRGHDEEQAAEAQRQPERGVAFRFLIIRSSPSGCQ